MKHTIHRTIFAICVALMGLPTLSAQAPTDSARTDSVHTDTLNTAPQAQAQATHGAVRSMEVTKALADSAYMRKDYKAAIEMYETLLATRGEAAMVYYNLGNSYYKTNQIAKAVLNFERARRMSPGTADIRFNLDLARSKTVDKIVPTSKVFLVSWLNALTNLTSETAWARLGVAAFILMLIGAACYFFAPTVRGKKVGFGAALFLLVLTILANVFAYSQQRQRLHRRDAIVMTPSISAKSTPGMSGTDLFVLHEGTKVRIKDDSMNEWKEIALEDGNVGWVPTQAIERI